jgi:enoyl-CoA hydratase/carnithine racemase
MRRITSLHPREARAVSTQDETLVTRDGPVVTLTFNRPEARNALTWGMYDRLYQVCEEVDADDSVRVLVLRGAGGKAFIAGTDISQFKVFERAEDGIAYERDGDKRIARLEAVGKPVVAQVEGFAVGGGFRIATACDLRIATPAARFGAPIARTLGNCLSMANYARAASLIGFGRLKDIIMRARLMEAGELLACGLLSEVTADEESLAPRAQELAEEVGANAPLTLWATKEALRRVRDRLLPEDADSDLIIACYMSNDFREGVDAFLNKRKPKWTGT